jgi:integrase/recombinase XerC
MKRSLRSSVRSFYRWAEIVGHVELSPALRLDTVRISRALPRPTPEDVLREALAAADDRQRLAIKLAAFAGLRRAEIAALHTSHIGATDILIIGKGGHQRRVPLLPDLRGEITAEPETTAR